MARLPPADRILVPARAGRERELETAVHAALEPHVRPFNGGVFQDGEYIGCQTSLVIARPGDEAVGRAFQGRPGLSPEAVVAVARFGRSDVFLSTERACLSPAKRLPVHDRYEALLEPVGPDPASGLRLVALQETLRLVPLEVAIEALVHLEASPLFREVQETFSRVPYASRLSGRRGPPPRVGLLRRLMGIRPPPPPLEPPPGQLKYCLERWLRPGAYRFGDLFIDARELKAQEIEVPEDSLAITVEFVEGTTPRHVHWRFRGTLLRAVLARGEIVAVQRLVV